MATKNTQRDAATESTETGDQDNQTTGQESTASETQQVTDSGSTEDTSASEQAEGSSTTTAQQDTDSNKSQLLADLHKERGIRKDLQTQVEQLQATLDSQSASSDELTALQGKYDRLESFLSKVGGPISKALDSRSFTKSLFESDEDIEKLVKDWHAANPTATASALGNNGASTSSGKPDISALLRAAAK